MDEHIVPCRRKYVAVARKPKLSMARDEADTPFPDLALMIFII